jgi:preprotein translocase subunit SecY
MNAISKLFAGLIGPLRDIWKIEELRQRIMYTLILLAAFRLGSYVILPGINTTILSQEFQQSQGKGILDLLNTFVGGAFSRGSVFALGIMPYISASIIIQLLGAAVPSIQKMQREGESGQRKINQLTRYLTTVITFFQAAGYVVNLQSQYPRAIMITGAGFWITTVFVLTAGTIFLVWLGERITDNGLGNGVSLIIAIGIISELPGAMINEARANPLMIFYVEILALALVTLLVILLTQGTRKIPIAYARHMTTSRIKYGVSNQARQFIPLKLNASGVMPIIFAQSIMFIPATIAQFFPESDFWLSANSWFADFKSIPYNIVFVLLIIVFTYFYTAIAINPRDIADQLKRSDAYIPGVQPGNATSQYIDTILTRITLPGSIFLAIIAILPAIVGRFGISSQFAQFFGGTSLLIMIGVVLDTLQQVESYLLMRHYDGLMKKGKTRARSPQNMAIAR